MPKTPVRAALAALLLAGCQAAPAPAPAPAADTAQLKLRPSYEAAGPAARRLQATITELTGASLDHVDIKLSVMAGASETPIAQTTLQQGEFDHEITFGSLKNDRTYKARAYAYALVGGSMTQVSLDADSVKTIDVAKDDAPTLQTLVVKLMPVAFAGTATSTGVTVGTGTLQHTGNESVSLAN